MNDSTKTIISGIAVIIGCFSMTGWVFYLAITKQVASGPWYGYFSSIVFFVIAIYFIFEVKKTIKERVG
jgi:hypothetical protein